MQVSIVCPWELSRSGRGVLWRKEEVPPLLDEPCRRHIWLVLFHRYEEEINRRTAAENEFVVLKKVSAREQDGRMLGGGRCGTESFWLETVLTGC